MFGNYAYTPDEIDYSDRIDKGVDVISAAWPNWLWEIDVKTLDIYNGQRCVTAQFAKSINEYNSWVDGAKMLKLDMHDIGSYVMCGFNVESGDTDQDGWDDYRPRLAAEDLTIMWRNRIIEMREKADPDYIDPQSLCDCGCED
jgi:hypothetical protein